MNTPLNLESMGPTGIRARHCAPEWRLALVLVCKLDASGTDGANPVLTVAGYVGIFAGWLDFEGRARAVFDDNGVNVLHAKEFYGTDGEFEGWGRPRKEGFIRQLQKCIVGRLELGITTSVRKSEFLRIKKERNIGHNESVLGFALRHSLARLLSDPVLDAAFGRGLALTVVHESGDKSAADAQRVFNELKAKHPEIRKRLADFGFADKESSIGLQIGDLLAVTSRKYINKTDALGAYPEEPAILSILRDGIFLIGDVVEGWRDE